MKSVRDIRFYLEKALYKKHKENLWSVDLSKSNHPISDKLLIQKYLEYGSEREWDMLKQAFKMDIMKDVWLKNMAIGSLHEFKQEKIVKSFFNINNPSKYLERKRKEHLENELARSY